MAIMRGGFRRNHDSLFSQHGLSRLSSTEFWHIYKSGCSVVRNEQTKDFVPTSSA